MKIILSIIKKEFIQLKRDPKMLRISIVAPIIQLLLLGYAVNLDINNIPTAVVDMDKTKESREFMGNFENSGYFSVNYHLDKQKEIDGLIDKGKISCAIVIPPDFSEKIISGKSAEIQVALDGADSNTATIGLNYINMIVLRYSQDIIIRSLKKYFKAEPGRISPEIRVWYNPALKSRNFMLPGVLALVLMVMTMILTSLAIVKEKEIGTMEQIIVTPIKPHELIIGKLVPFAVIGLVDIVLVVLVTSLWFGIAIKGSILLLFLLCIAFLLSTLGLGLFISTVSKTQQQAMMTAFFFFMIPMMFFSGFVFPIENMPQIIQFISYFFPIRYFFVIVRGIFLKGVGFYELWDETAALIAFGIIILSFSVLRFRKKIV